MKLLLIIGGVLLTGIVAIIQYFDDEKNKTEVKENEKKLNEKIDTLQENNNNLSGQLTNLLIENSKLSHQLTETSLKLNESAIGAGDVKVEFSMVNNDEFRFRIKNDNPIPIYDAYITITSQNELLNCEVIKKDENNIVFNQDCIKSAHQEMPMTINPGATIVTSKSYKVEENSNFTINVISRKKSITIQYALFHSKGIWGYSDRYFELVNNKLQLISQNVSADLPKNFWKKYFFETRIIKFSPK